MKKTMDRRFLAPARRPRWTTCLVVALVLMSLTGCVRRRMTIRSTSTGGRSDIGALVYVDDYEVGTTPIAQNFTYYGTRKIRLVKDGYETMTVMQPMRPPWWQIPPIDFVTENLLPGELTDSRTLAYQMTPQRIVPPDELRGRAEQLRSQMQPVCYTEPIAQEVPAYPTQPAIQPIPSDPMVPMQPGPVQPGPVQPGTVPSSTYQQPGEWISPGNIAPANSLPPGGSQPYPTQQPYYQPQSGVPSSQPYTQPSLPASRPYYYPQPGPGVTQ